MPPAECHLPYLSGGSAMVAKEQTEEDATWWGWVRERKGDSWSTWEKACWAMDDLDCWIWLKNKYPRDPNVEYVVLEARITHP